MASGAISLMPMPKPFRFRPGVLGRRTRYSRGFAFNRRPANSKLLGGVALQPPNPILPAAISLRETLYRVLRAMAERLPPIPADVGRLEAAGVDLQRQRRPHLTEKGWRWKWTDPRTSNGWESAPGKTAAGYSSTPARIARGAGAAWPHVATRRRLIDIISACAIQ